MDTTLIIIILIVVFLLTNSKCSENFSQNTIPTSKELCQYDNKTPQLHDSLQECIDFFDDPTKVTPDQKLMWKEMLDSENLPKGCNSFCDDGTGNQALTKSSMDVGYLICRHSPSLKYNYNNMGSSIKNCERMVAFDYQFTNLGREGLITKYGTDRVDWY